MSNSSEDQLEWWRMTERVIDQIPEISDAIIAIQGTFLLVFLKFLKIFFSRHPLATVARRPAGHGAGSN